ncbi:MAG: YkgJ family cysteine cluster protein [Phycisphaerae bacterium]|nr:YkgJ family cysteine cluster protein [Phycisphaerae bacterium]
MAKKKSMKKNPCEKCNGLCCRYMALEIDTPRSRDDFDDIRWYLVHKGVSVFVDKKQWYLCTDNKCKYLSGKDNRCKIYAKRPRICREHKSDNCELGKHDYDYEMHFNNDKQMEEYIKIRFDNNKRSHSKRGKTKSAKNR